MAETLDATSSIESTTVGVYRTAATVKGGRRFSFSAMVVVGDRQGSVGYGYGKANQVPPAIEKAQKQAKRRMKQFPMIGRTIPHEVTGRFGACIVRLIPASPGTGVIAGAAVRAPLEMMGVQDCLTKSFGSNNSKNLVKAVINGLEQLRSKEHVEQLRGQELGKSRVEESIERAQAFFGSSENTGGRDVEPMKAPTGKQPDSKKGGRRGGKQGGRGGGGGRRPGPQEAKPASGAGQAAEKPKQTQTQQQNESAQSSAGSEPDAENKPKEDAQE